ncbi:AMP-binding protein [Rubrivirga sp. IMCC43871]|uniref:AMP-binding protein n=1 Tax=Rubrivirga sp. IMCC43871 TaxID=3391575 RepID=UPI00398F927F
MTPSGHTDPFARDHLPPRDLWPDFVLPEGSVFDYPERLNAAAALLDGAADAGWTDRPLVLSDGPAWTYGDLRRRASQIAHALRDDLGLVPGNRVLLHGPNTPELAACWFAIGLAGGIVVATMPLLRAFELGYTCEKAQIRLALCDAACAAAAEGVEGGPLERIVRFNAFPEGDDGARDELAALADGKPTTVDAVDTAADDVALIAFTSGTTGTAKATMHFHRDVLAICDAFPRTLGLTADDVVTGTPPLAFTFGLGGELLFPMRVGASTAFIPKPSVPSLLDTLETHRATVCFTSPTAYRAMLGHLEGRDLSALRLCVSAGEPLPAPTFHAWRDATGLEIVDGIGSTEMLHIFLSSPPGQGRPGATGKPIPGYDAKVVGKDGREVGPGTVGLLAVRGPTGCRYLDDPARQRQYVKDGWNYPGDAYLVDDDGFFHYQSRADDMIITSGYNVSGLQVESALLLHPAVAECGVIGVPDAERGHLVKAFVAVHEGVEAGEALATELQDFVKAQIAPYKYPRAVQFLDALPRTQTGKLQRFRLRDL